MHPPRLRRTADRPEVGIVIPDGTLGHNSQLGGAGDGPGAGCDEGKYRALAEAGLGGNWGLLNGAPFRITD